jgi:ArsR family transcriptional regulator
MDSITDLFRVFSDRTRIRILLLLDGHSLCVCQLMGALGLPQPRVSQQLSILKRSKAVISTRRGKWIYYEINPRPDDDLFPTLLALASKSDCDAQTFEADRAALQACLKQQEKTGRCDLSAFEDIRARVDALRHGRI